MSSFQNDIFMPPPAPGNLGWRPMGDNGDGRMNMPIGNLPSLHICINNKIQSTVVALILSIVLFILFLWFFLSPHFVQRDVSQTPPRPDRPRGRLLRRREHLAHLAVRLGRAHAQGGALPRRALHRLPAARVQLGAEPPFLPGQQRPPFILAQQQHRGGRAAPLIVPPPARRPSPRLTRSASAPPVISKPIPLPEFPLPGPEVLTESDARRTTVVHPPAAPSRSVSDSMLHPPSAHLPAPSQAVVHDGTTRRPLTVSQRSLGYLNASSSRYSQFPGAPDLDASVASSRIGLAL